MRIAAPVCVLLAACTSVPPHTGHPAARWMSSPNVDERRPHFVVLHHTSGNTVEEALRTLTDRGLAVSAHYVVGRDGTLYQLVDERRRAWHAGASRWGMDNDLNSASIGIELDNNGREPYAEAQIRALLALLADLKARYRMPASNFLGHGDVAPGRKVDPSAFFPWQRLAANGFGLWCDAAADIADLALDPLLALRAFGYDVTNPDAAVRAFNRHFMGLEDSGELQPEARARLRCLLELPRDAYVAP